MALGGGISGTSLLAAHPGPLAGALAVAPPFSTSPRPSKSNGQTLGTDMYSSMEGSGRCTGNGASVSAQRNSKPVRDPPPIANRSRRRCTSWHAQERSSLPQSRHQPWPQVRRLVQVLGASSK